jgi:hypothetical protein
LSLNEFLLERFFLFIGPLDAVCELALHDGLQAEPAQIWLSLFGHIDWEYF